MKAFIICKNYEMVKVVLSDKKRALKELTKLSDADFNLRNKIQPELFKNSKEAYVNRINWHLYELEVLI